MKVSVIIPVKEINGYVFESNRFLLELDYEDFEIIVFPDRDSGIRLPRTRIIATGPAGPAEKRDLAIKYAEGEILAFLDDDAYPERDWLKKAVRHFKDPDVAAVGGPAVTPETDTVLQKASGEVFASFLTSAGYIYRYVPRPYREVDDYPTVNLLVRRDVFERLGGFDTDYWPGEDTKLCLDITAKLGMKIVYDPEVLVYHHRRPLFRPHLKQVARYAFQRGCFVKRFPKTSLRPGYFVPSLFLMVLVSGPAATLASPVLLTAYGSVIVLYAFVLVLASFAAALRARDISVGIMTVPGIFLTHITYGFNFLRGLLLGTKGPERAVET